MMIQYRRFIQRTKPKHEHESVTAGALLDGMDAGTVNLKASTVDSVQINLKEFFSIQLFKVVFEVGESMMLITR